MMVTGDYRRSHLEKGEDYDQSLSHSTWAEYMTQQEIRHITRVIPALFGGPVPRYLDFACGTGRITRVVEPLAEVSYGVDVSPRMLEAARQTCLRTSFIQKDITRDPLDIEPVHLISSFRFFGNAQDELRMSALKALHQLLIPGGFLIINNHRNPYSVQNLARKWGGETLVEDLHYFKLRRLLDEAGFKIRFTLGIGFWLFRARWKSEQLLNSTRGRFLELSSRVPFARPFCPDAVIVAQR